MDASASASGGGPSSPGISGEPDIKVPLTFFLSLFSYFGVLVSQPFFNPAKMCKWQPGWRLILFRSGHRLLCSCFNFIFPSPQSTVLGKIGAAIASRTIERFKTEGSKVAEMLTKGPVSLHMMCIIGGFLTAMSGFFGMLNLLSPFDILASVRPTKSQY